MTYRRPVLAVTLLTATVALAACSGTTSTASKSAAHATAGNSSILTTGPTSISPSSPPSSTTQPSASSQASGRCSSIDKQTAESILGFATAAGISSSAGGSPGMRKIDGCSYRSTTDGGLGYDVLQVNVQLGQAMIGAAKARMAQAGAQVTAFDIGVSNSVCFTQHLPLGVDSQVAVQSGDRFITVAATRKDGNVAKAQASATAAAQRLVSHS